MIVVPKGSPRISPKVLLPLSLIAFIIASLLIGQSTKKEDVPPTPFVMDLSSLPMKSYVVDITRTDEDKNANSFRGTFNYVLLTSFGDWKEIEIQGGESNIMICWTERLDTGTQYVSKACGYNPNNPFRGRTVLEAPGFYYSQYHQSCSNGDGNQFEIVWISQTTIKLSFKTTCGQNEEWIITFKAHDLYPNGAG